MDYNELTLPPRYVITIGRTFGSGGRALGRLIADRLGIAYYDKELLAEAARMSGLSDEYVTAHDERVPSFISGAAPFNIGLSGFGWYSGAGSSASDNVYRAQCDLLMDIARREPCVIVGRSSDYVLRDTPCLVNVFVHAPVEHCLSRIIERMDSPDPRRARSLAEKTNRLRAEYYNFYTEKKWGDARSYHLTFDSSELPLSDIADMVIDYLYRKYGSAATQSKSTPCND